MKIIFRRLSHAPMFAATALITLGLGIGATTAIFGVVENVIIKPLPFPDAGSLVSIWHSAPGVPGLPDGRADFSPTMYFTYREQNRSFEHIGLWSFSGATITGMGEPDELRAVRVTDGVLQALGVQPMLGRWFTASDDTPSAPGTAILTYPYWQRRFGGDPSVIGRTITADSAPHRIIGVMPADFRFSNNPEILMPEQFDRSKIFLGDFSYQGVARLKPGVTLSQANADVERMLPIWLHSWSMPPGFSRSLFENAHFAPALTPLKQDVVGNIGPTLWLLLGAVAMVLLIACANVANLLLVRAENRQQELAIRAALGAGRGRMAREMIHESAVLGLFGGALGLGFADAALQVLVAKGPATLPRLSEIHIDPRVLAFAVAASALASVWFAVMPMLKYSRPDLISALRGGGRALSESRERHRTRDWLVVGQVALALVLLVGSGLMLRTFQALRDVQPGFAHPEQVQLLRIYVNDQETSEPERVMRMENEMLDKLAAIPGVVSAALTSSAPMDGFRSTDVLYAKDKEYRAGEIPPLRRFFYITPGLLKTMGTPLIAGREFDWKDLYQKRDVAMISENAAVETWGSVSAALGKFVRESSADPWREVVGVAANVYHDGTQQLAPPSVYWPAMMDKFRSDQPYVTRGGVFVIRTSRAGTESFLKQARQALWSVNGNLPTFLVQTLQDLYDGSLARTSFTLALLAIAGGMALLLGVVGIYGVIAYAVSQRTREMGIRLALGAQPRELRRMFVRQGLMLACIGSVLGLAGAAALTRLMKTLLFGVAPLDPVTYAAVALFLISAVALASYVPARRASAVDPVEALRAE